MEDALFNAERKVHLGTMHQTGDLPLAGNMHFSELLRTWDSESNQVNAYLVLHEPVFQ